MLLLVVTPESLHCLASANLSNRDCGGSMIPPWRLNADNLDLIFFLFRESDEAGGLEAERLLVESEFIAGFGYVLGLLVERRLRDAAVREAEVEFVVGNALALVEHFAVQPGEFTAAQAQLDAERGREDLLGILAVDKLLPQVAVDLLGAGFEQFGNGAVAGARGFGHCEVAGLGRLRHLDDLHVGCETHHRALVNVE